MRKLPLTAAASLAFLAGTAVLAGTAGAHATFSTSTVPADATATIYMDVPHERADTIYNTQVVVAMPTGWSATGCQSKATWTCSVGTQSGRQAITFTKAAGAGPAEDEGFTFTVRTGGVGTYSLPVLQTYSSGETVSWIGASGSPTPAPVLRAVASAPPSTAPPATAAPAPAPPAPSGGQGASAGDGAPGATGPTATAGPDGAGAAGDATAAGPDAGDPGEVGDGPTTTSSAPDATTPEEADGELASATSNGDNDGGGGAALVVAGVVVVVGAAVGGGLIARSNRQRRAGG